MSPATRVRRRRFAEILPVAAAWGAALAVLAFLGAAERLDRAAADLLHPRLAHHLDEDSPMLLVVVDEASLAEFGRWPWPRRRLADLVDRLRAARAVALHVAVTEPDLLDPAGDAMLGRAVEEHGRVAIPVLGGGAAGGPELPPLMALATGAAALGHVDLLPDPDGILRRPHLWAGSVGAHWPSLALAALRLASPERFGDLADDHPPPALPADGSWDRSRPLVMHLPNVAGARRLSAADVLAGRVGEPLWRDRVAFVGVTAPALGESVLVPGAGRGAGPDTRRLHGVEVQLALAHALEVGHVLVPAPGWAAPAWTFLAGFGAVVGLGRGVGLGTVLTLGSAAAAAGTALAMAAGLWLPPGGPAAATLLLAPPVLYLARREAAAALALEQERARTALHAIGDAIVIAADGADAPIGFANPAAERLLPGPLKGRRLDAAVRLLDPGTGARLGPEGLGEGDRLALVEAAGGGRREVRVAARRLPGTGLEPAGSVVVLSDVSELARLNRRLLHETTHDGLTGLPNRGLLGDRLDQALARARRSGEGLAVFFADLDRFKDVNDALGHDAGDELLRQVAGRLVEACRRDDLVARLGGDEFVVVAERLSAGPEGAAAVAGKLARAFDRPFRLRELELFVAPSVGGAVFPVDGRDGPTLLRRADAAMYEAKRAGGGTRMFSAEINARTLEQLVLQQDLHLAVKAGELRVHYQPTVDLADGRLAGFEALLRWPRPDGTSVPPGVFVPVAESTGLIEPITEWVMGVACRQAVAWTAAGGPPVPVAVNVSPRQFLHADLAALVGRVLAETGLPGERLLLELTETVLMRDPDRAASVLAAVKGLGVTVAVDDFGTGYSSLGYLRRLPIDHLKVDRSFVANIGRDRRDEQIIGAVVGLAGNLGLGVVAEGVETREQAGFLGALGCGRAQGYLFSPAVPPEDAARLAPDFARRLLQGVAGIATAAATAGAPGGDPPFAPGAAVA